MTEGLGAAAEGIEERGLSRRGRVGRGPLTPAADCSGLTGALDLSLGALHSNTDFPQATCVTAASLHLPGIFLVLTRRTCC